MTLAELRQKRGQAWEQAKAINDKATAENRDLTAEEQEAWENKPRLPVRAVATGEQPIVRFIGQTDAAANPAFWAPWVDRVARWIADGRRPLVFLHTPDNVVAPQLCREFHAEVVGVAGIEPLDRPPPIATEVALFDDVT